MKLRCLALFCTLPLVSLAADQPSHVVLIVWDGMRPDFVTPEYAPVLNKLAHEGVRFRNHHSVYTTATDVNGAALASGCYPERNGLFANLEYRPTINPRQPVDTGEPETIRRGDEVSNGNYLTVPTICELLRSAGKQVALAGSKSVAILFDRHNDWTVAPIQDRPLTAFAGAPLPLSARLKMIDELGPLVTGRTATTGQRNDYTTRALTQFLWRDGVPAFSLLWLSEPDFAEHNFGPGSPEAIAGVHAVDRNLAAVLGALDQKNARDSTDILVVSDHGFSTIRRTHDAVDLLNSAGFRAGKEFSDKASPGNILVAGNGGSLLFYVKDHDAGTTARLVSWLQHCDFAGVLFTRTASEGTFPLSLAHIDTAYAADVVMSCRWYEENNERGAPGVIDADWNRKPGQGTHATLSSHDLHNILIAAGPDFRSGFEDTAPTGNVDLAPTLCHILKLPAPVRWDGRILTEALLDGEEAPPPRKRERKESLRDFSDGRWSQHLELSQVQDTVYLDEGNGTFTAR